MYSRPPGGAAGWMAMLARVHSSGTHNVEFSWRDDFGMAGAARRQHLDLLVRVTQMSRDRCPAPIPKCPKTVPSRRSSILIECLQRVDSGLLVFSDINIRLV